MFVAVPPRYDIVNHVVTLGLDTRWRRLAACEVLSGMPGTFLDIGCGTGDLALAAASMSTMNTSIAGLDYSQPMLDRAVIKAAKRAAAVSFIRAEVLRVLRPGGRFIIVESSQPPNRVFRWLFQRYVRWFVRPAGIAVSGNPGAYRYLAESVARFYTADEVVSLLMNSGFNRAGYKRLFFGAAAVHTAVK
jgi:demethylmenaquinone methyltransferase/2-methoxy-6-polyprenyl-1,4-benzoquinol methylase